MCIYVLYMQQIDGLIKNTGRQGRENDCCIVVIFCVVCAVFVTVML